MVRLDLVDCLPATLIGIGMGLVWPVFFVSPGASNAIICAEVKKMKFTVNSFYLIEAHACGEDVSYRKV